MMMYIHKPLWVSVTLGSLLLLISCAATGSPIAGGEGEPPIPQIGPALSEPEQMDMNRSALAYVSALHIGWNLGNSLDAYTNGVASETAWGNPRSTPQLFKGVAQAGFDVVRIPVTWLGHIGTASSGYKLDEAWLRRVAEVVGYARDAGLKVIINIHHDGADSQHWLSIREASASETKRTLITRQLVSVWTQIASYFKNHGDYLLFETMNEIHDGGWGWGDNRKDNGKQYAILNEWNQVVVEAIRSTGGNNRYRYIVIPGYVTNPDLTVEHLRLPRDPTPGKLIVTVHFYDPADFAIFATVSQWGAGARSLGNTSWAQEAHVRSTFAKLKATFIDTGVPVYLGEYGAVRQKGTEAFRSYYMEYVTLAARTYGILPIYWDNGATGTGKEQFGIIDRQTGSIQPYAKDMVQRMIKASRWKGENSYTLEQLEKQAPTP